MKRYWLPLLCVGLLLPSGMSIRAHAQSSSKAAIQAPHINASARAHLEKAWDAAWRPGHSLMVLYERVCAPALSLRGPVEPGLQVGASFAARVRNRPARSDWYSEPAKVFDNLYWIGSMGNGYSVPSDAGDSIWAVTTSEGIILLDAAHEYQSVDLITDGLEKLGLDPADIKYVVVSHAHGDRYFGAKYVQETYNAQIILSEADWDTLAKSNEAEETKPRRDMVATDGMELTLGDTTLTLHITPGHTPGTVSTLVPLKDGNETHIGVLWGGINPSFERYGVRYYSSLEETFNTWADSAGRMRGIVAETGADVYLTIHPFYDNALDKIHAVKYREPSDVHPLVSQGNLDGFLAIIEECTRAQLARISP